VHFATDSAELLPDSVETLNYGIATLKRYPQMVMREHGVTNSMTAKGYGQELRIASDATREGRQANRRVNLRIVGGP
jgi:outer membrane protein OmpA-like peptidoglycan-associated protein